MHRETRNAFILALAVWLVAAAPTWQWPKTATVDDFGNIIGGQVPMSVGSAPLAYISTGTGTVGTSSGVLVAAGAYHRSLTIQTLPDSTCNTWLRPSGAVAAANVGALVQGGGGAFTFGTIGSPMPTTNITAITDCGSPQTVLLVGG